MSLCLVEEHQSWVKCNVEHWWEKGHNINSDVILVLIAQDHSNKHGIMEDISIEQRKPFFEEGKRTGTPGHLQFSPDYQTTKLSRTSLFSNFNSNFKICFSS